MKIKKPRRQLSENEKIVRHVDRHNAKQIAAVPLFADQVQELAQIGVIRLKTVDGFKVWLENEEKRHADFKQDQLHEAQRYEAWVKDKDATLHARKDAEHKRMGVRAPSLLQPHYLADHWFQVIRQHWGDLQARIVLHNDEEKGRTEWEFWGSKP